jgi:predicted N-acetyltransferase YhbS
VTPSPLREATAPDASAIAALINAAFEVERFFVEGSRTNVNEILEHMRKGRFLVTEAGGRMTGCVYYESRGERGYFGLLAVHPADKGKGLGRMMVAAVEDELRKAGCQAVDIRVVNLRRELPPFYRRLGYEETGTEPFTAGAATKQACHFICMSKPLGAARA